MVDNLDIIENSELSHILRPNIFIDIIGPHTSACSQSTKINISLELPTWNNLQRKCFIEIDNYMEVTRQK